MSPVAWKISFAAAGSLLLATAALADVTSPKERFDVIRVRNAFGLREQPPPAPTNAPTPPAGPVNIKFTGITVSTLGKKAWFMIPPQPPKSVTPQYLSLAEGEKQGDVEVLSINDKESTVKILNAGSPLEMNFQTHGLAAPLVPAAAPILPGGIPAPGAVNAPGAIRTAGGAPVVPAYNPVAPPVANVTPQATTMTAGTPLRTIPARNVRTTPMESMPQYQNVQPQPQPEIDPAIQYLKARAHAEQARKDGIVYPPLPVPVHLNPE